jgi:6-phosphofructokinase
MARGKLGILVGGGPAPGINGVISAATIQAIDQGLEVVGIYDGFQWLSEGDTSKILELTADNVSRIYFRGGSLLRTSRANPTQSTEMMNNVVGALKELNVDYLITIGGLDTAYSARMVEDASNGSVKVAHIPKTIDNDLPLPQEIPTLGFSTAVHVGQDIVKNLMEDSFTANRWFFVVTMGRKAGHLALGIGKASGTTLTLIPEEFRGMDNILDRLCDTLEGALMKRLSQDKEFGVAILSEGLAEICIDELEKESSVERDPFGHIRLAEIDFGRLVKNKVRDSLKSRGIKMTIVSKNIGYELRCSAPIPFDIEYSKDLGFSAVKFLVDQGGSKSMVSIQGGKFIPLPFDDIMDPETGKMRVRFLDIRNESYEVARYYMIRLNHKDFEPQNVKRLASVAKMTEKEFIDRFRYCWPS